MSRMLPAGLLLASLVIALGMTAVAETGPRPVTVFLDRNGRTVEHEGEEVTIPKFGGGDQTWAGIVGCVKAQFAPFQIDVVDTRPRSGDFISAVVGGRASQMDLDDRNTNGVGPYIPGRVQRNAVVHIFSKVSGERDAKNLCAVTVHEVAHALGLDHTFKCGDMMSYFLDRCGPRKFMDVDAPCGEFSTRTCGTGAKTQNSYRMLVNLVGLRQTDGPTKPQPAKPQPAKPQPQPQPQPDLDHDDAEDPADDTAPTRSRDDDDDAEEPVQVQEQPRRWRGRGGQSVERYRDADGRTWVIIRRYR